MGALKGASVADKYHYSALSVLKAALSSATFRKLSGEDNWRVIKWNDLAIHLAPEYMNAGSPDLQNHKSEEEFKSRITCALNELRRAGLVDGVWNSVLSEQFTFTSELHRKVAKMAKADLFRFVETRIYECLPWLKDPNYGI